jgi:hypothetical protein
MKASKTEVNSRLRFFTKVLGTFFILAAGVPKFRMKIKYRKWLQNISKLLTTLGIRVPNSSHSKKLLII